MQKSLFKIYRKARNLCQPNPKTYPDPSVRQLAHDRNLINFYSLSFFFITGVSVLLFVDVPFMIKLASFSCHTFMLASFFAFCRSYIWIYNVLFVIMSSLVQFYGFEIDPNVIYFHVGQVVITLAQIVVMTGDIWLSFCSLVMQIVIMLTKFKDKLSTCILEEGPDGFADKFVKNMIVYFVLIFVVNIILVKILEKRSIELSRAKMATENTLEQQKTFIFSFSHELRNPINSLLGNLQLVLQGGEAFSPKTKEMLNTAKVCGELLLHNINNVLDTGKNEIGRLEINPVPTPLNELFQRTWAIYSELFRQKKLKGQLKIEKDLPPVAKIDSYKVNQILLNLIGNAIKFTEKGSVVVMIKWLKQTEVNDQCFEPTPYDDTDEGLFEKEENLSTVHTSVFAESIPGFLGVRDDKRLLSTSHLPQPQPQREARGVLKIIVQDTGPGMKKESLEKLFKKFSQVSEDVSQRNIGTGLGLFITKEICNAMKGEIRAYSKFNKGTTFIACIPTTSVPMNNVQKIDSESILQQLTTKHLKALVADDSPFNVNLTCNYFAQFGASVVFIAYNGHDAFLKYKECQSKNINIDIVTLDIDMPVMDGRKVCDGIREYEREKRLQPVIIILISGNYEKEQIEEYLDPRRGRKADCFLRKPISFSEFHRAVYSLVNENL